MAEAAKTLPKVFQELNHLAIQSQRPHTAKITAAAITTAEIMAMTAMVVSTFKPASYQQTYLPFLHPQFVGAFGGSGTTSTGPEQMRLLPKTWQVGGGGGLAGIGQDHALSCN